MSNEFEKWNKQKGCNVVCNDCNICNGSKEAWKACLEWILENSSCEDACDFKENIQKELDLLNQTNQSRNQSPPNE